MIGCTRPVRITYIHTQHTSLCLPSVRRILNNVQIGGQRAAQPIGDVVGINIIDGTRKICAPLPAPRWVAVSCVVHVSDEPNTAYTTARWLGMVVTIHVSIPVGWLVNLTCLLTLCLFRSPNLSSLWWFE